VLRIKLFVAPFYSRSLTVELGDNIILLCQINTATEQPRDHYENVIFLTNLDHLTNCNSTGNTDHLGVCATDGFDVTIAVTDSPGLATLPSFEAGQEYYLTSELCVVV